MTTLVYVFVVLVIVDTAIILYGIHIICEIPIYVYKRIPAQSNFELRLNF